MPDLTCHTSSSAVSSVKERTLADGGMYVRYVPSAKNEGTDSDDGPGTTSRPCRISTAPATTTAYRAQRRRSVRASSHNAAMTAMAIHRKMGNLLGSALFNSGTCPISASGMGTSALPICSLGPNESTATTTAKHRSSHV